MAEYGIGGQERKTDNASEGISEIPLNRTLFIEKLTSDPPLKPEIIEGLSTIEEVFQHFQPGVDLSFTNEEGVSTDETLHFRSLSDFGKTGIINQSNFLQDLNSQVDDYQKFTKQLKSNKILKSLLDNPEAKADYISILKALVVELEQSEQ
jgi:hypothetical protein